MARPLRQTEETLHRLFGGLLVAGPIGLLLATLGGYLLAAAALRPVESMRRRASAISATTPGARLPVPPSRDEIRDLAETLNEMLARLEAALEHERRFVADASHELRTPLALLKAELELALRRPRTRGGAPRSGRIGRRGDRPARAPRRGSAPHRPLRPGGARAAGRARRPRCARSLHGRPLRRACLDRAPAGRRRDTAAHRGLGRQAPARAGAAQPRRQRAGVRRRTGHDHGARMSATRSRSTSSTRARDSRRTSRRARSSGSPEVTTRAHAAAAGLGLAIVEAVAQAHGGSAGIAPNGKGADVWISLPVRPGP